MTLFVLGALGGILAGVGGTVLTLSLLHGGGRHVPGYVPRHRGWEGREKELKRFKAAFLVAKRASLHLPSVDEHAESALADVWPERDTDRVGAVNP